MAHRKNPEFRSRPEESPFAAFDLASPDLDIDKLRRAFRDREEALSKVRLRIVPTASEVVSATIDLRLPEETNDEKRTRDREVVLGDLLSKIPPSVKEVDANINTANGVASIVMIHAASIEKAAESTFDETFAALKFAKIDLSETEFEYGSVTSSNGTYLEEAVLEEIFVERRALAIGEKAVSVAELEEAPARFWTPVPARVSAPGVAFGH